MSEPEDLLGKVEVRFARFAREREIDQETLVLVAQPISNVLTEFVMMAGPWCVEQPRGLEILAGLLRIYAELAEEEAEERNGSAGTDG